MGAERWRALACLLLAGCHPVAMLTRPEGDGGWSAARRAAEEALLDRALMVVSPQAYAAFLERLDQPAQPNDRLRRTMRARAPWRTA